MLGMLAEWLVWEWEGRFPLLEVQIRQFALDEGDHKVCMCG